MYVILVEPERQLSVQRVVQVKVVGRQNFKNITKHKVARFIPRPSLLSLLSASSLLVYVRGCVENLISIVYPSSTQQHFIQQQ